MAIPCPNCGNSEYEKKYICGKDYEDAVKNNDIYCGSCVKNKPKKDPIKLKGMNQND